MSPIIFAHVFFLFFAIFLNVFARVYLFEPGGQDFDPNFFSGGIDLGIWDRLLANPEDPLGNKAIQGLYAPGSIFKIITAYAGLDQGVITPQTEHVCKAEYFIKGRDEPFKCWKEEGHGKVNLLKAIMGSCNVYFYNTGVGAGVEQIHKYAKLFR